MDIDDDAHPKIRNATSKWKCGVKYEGKKYQWPVVRVLSRKDERGGQSLTELTIDPATLRIGRFFQANASTSGSERTLIHVTVDFSTFRIGESIADSTFVFLPPKNARLVDAVPVPGQTGSYLLNRPAPDLELKTLEGDRVRLSELRGRPVLLTFWASWCGPCRRELPGLVKVAERFKDRLVVLGVNDEGRSKARKYAQEAGLTFPTLDDFGLKAHRLYRVRSIPTGFLIDAEGKIVRFMSGAKSEAELMKIVQSAGL
ncbi:MAG: redoxin domain-containing protein [Acidobacteria bacterium]|nr:redoxin domain-containing protein [Acidobacteriota bacterium]